MTFPIYGKIKNMFQSPPTSWYLIACNPFLWAIFQPYPQIGVSEKGLSIPPWDLRDEETPSDWPLSGGFSPPTPLKNNRVKVSWDDDIPFPTVSGKSSSIHVPVTTNQTIFGGFYRPFWGWSHDRRMKSCIQDAPPSRSYSLLSLGSKCTCRRAFYRPGRPIATNIYRYMIYIYIAWFLERFRHEISWAFMN